ncbi:MAG: hypothetical protein GY816_17465, partial [Cytophagales bacterium]|nr:hypothetical protein [Cytophagales bacterium]
LPEELTSVTEQRKRDSFDNIIKEKIGDSIYKPNQPPPYEYIPYADGELDPPIADELDEDPIDEEGKAIFEKPITDQLIHAEVRLPQGESMQDAKVLGKSKNQDGSMNTDEYEVEFPDGLVREYGENLIAESVYSQVDIDGKHQKILEGIIDYDKVTGAADKSDKYIFTQKGNKRLRNSTKGWKLLVAWKDGSEQWIPLSVMKTSNPIEVAEFAVAKNIDSEASFSWWVPYTLRKRDGIVSAVKKRVKHVTHKYGIEIPKSVEDAKHIDKANGNTLWWEAICKEMKIFRGIPLLL